MKKAIFRDSWAACGMYTWGGQVRHTHPPGHYMKMFVEHLTSGHMFYASQTNNKARLSQSGDSTHVHEKPWAENRFGGQRATAYLQEMVDGCVVAPQGLLYTR